MSSSETNLDQDFNSKNTSDDKLDSIKDTSNKPKEKQKEYDSKENKEIEKKSSSKHSSSHHHSSKKCSSHDKYKNDKKSEKRDKDKHRTHHRDRSSDSKLHRDDKKSRHRSRSSSSSSDRKHSKQSHSRHNRSRSPNRSRDRSRDRPREYNRYREDKDRDRDRYRKHSDYDTKRKTTDDKREEAKSFRRSTSKPIEIVDKIEETQPKNVDEIIDTSEKMNEILKKIEVPKEMRFNPKEASKFQMEQLRKKTEELTGVKVPSFYNTNAINPLAYAEQQKKRKLLWSKAKDNENTTTGIVGRAIIEGQDEKTAEKFRKLMGIKSVESSNAANSVSEINKMQQQAFEQMDKEYQFARMTTHTHRGMGLGFGSNATLIDPNIIQKAPQINK